MKGSDPDPENPFPSVSVSPVSSLLSSSSLRRMEDLHFVCTVAAAGEAAGVTLREAVIFLFSA
jgi:hypothetical protein